MLLVGIGRINKTTNAGLNWLSCSSGSNQRIGCLYFTDANTGYAVGDSQVILKTTNAGSSWFSQSTFGVLGYESVYLHFTKYRLSLWATNG